MLRRFMLIAIPLLCTACGLRTEQAREHLDRGDSALARKDVQAALAEFREAVRLNPELPAAHEKLGEAYRESGDLPKAAESLETAVRLDPQNFHATFELGDVYRLLDRLSQAIRVYVLACRLDPNNFESRFRLAVCYQDSGELEQAVAAYHDALKLAPNNAKAWFNLGAVHDVRGARYEAIQAYKRSLECDTDQPIVLVNLATVYMNQDRYEVARRTLEAALKMAPDLAIVHERIGYCDWRTGHNADAARAYREAIAISDKNPRAFAGLGVVLMNQYLDDPSKLALRDEAIESWHRSLELDPQQEKLRELIRKYRPQPQRPGLGIE